MSLRLVPRFCTLAWLTLLAGCDRRAPPLPKFPGAPVILISVDTLRADHLPVYGYTKVETPHVDALVRDSILFENAVSHVPLTLPSHLSILTGLLPAEHGVRANLGYRFDGKTHQTLARALRRQGYATGAAVSTYVLRGATGIDDSFDLFDDAVGSGVEWTPDVSLLQRKGDLTAARALAWVETVKTRPFFLFLHLYEPHLPHEPREPFKARYGATYDGEVATSDAIVGELLDPLRRNGLYDRAIVVLVSDHGEGLLDHGEREHGILLYREVLHVPLLLKLPGSRDRGTRVGEPVGLASIAPTITSLLGLEMLPPQGVSLLRRGPAAEAAAGGVYSETYYPEIHFGWSPLRSLTSARHHYIDGPAPELYDVVRDPREAADVLPANEALARAMKKELDRYPAGAAAPTRVDPEVAERLQALGYLGKVAPKEGGGPRTNPKDKIHVHEALQAASQLGLQGRNEEASQALHGLVRENPDSFEARRDLAGALARLGRYPEAAAAYQEAGRLSPRLAQSVALPLGQVQLAMGQFAEAEASARAAVEEDPPQAHQLLARVALARGDLAEAERQARLVMAEAGAETAGAMLQAQVHLRRSELAQALAVLDAQAPAVLDAQAPAVLGAQAPAVLDAQAPAVLGAASSPVAERTEPKRPPVPGLGPLRADVLGRLGRFAEAEAVLREDLRFFPTRAQTYASLAVLLSLQGRPRSEVRDILESMAKASPGRETLLLGAKTLDFVGDKSGAAAWRRRAAAGPASR